MRRSRAGHRGARGLGIGLLILGMFHVPLPQPDFHNVRHHDAPGEVCNYHDHLLRWHPGAGAAQDVATLHWHWFLPSDGPAGTGGEGAALHAHVAGWEAPMPEVGPPVTPRDVSRFVAEVPPAPLLMAVLDETAAPLRIRTDPVRGFGATFAPHASLPCLLQRWAC